MLLGLDLIWSYLGCQLEAKDSKTYLMWYKCITLLIIIDCINQKSLSRCSPLFCNKEEEGNFALSMKEDQGKWWERVFIITTKHYKPVEVAPSPTIFLVHVSPQF